MIEEKVIALVNKLANKQNMVLDKIKIIDNKFEELILSEVDCANIQNPSFLTELNICVDICEENEYLIYDQVELYLELKSDRFIRSASNFLSLSELLNCDFSDELYDCLKDDYPNKAESLTNSLNWSTIEVWEGNFSVDSIVVRILEELNNL